MSATSAGLTVLTTYLVLMLLWAMWGSVWGHTDTVKERGLWVLAVAHTSAILGGIAGMFWCRT